MKRSLKKSPVFWGGAIVVRISLASTEPACCARRAEGLRNVSADRVCI